MTNRMHEVIRSEYRQRERLMTLTDEGLMSLSSLTVNHTLYGDFTHVRSLNKQMVSQGNA